MENKILLRAGAGKGGLGPCEGCRKGVGWGSPSWVRLSCQSTSKRGDGLAAGPPVSKTMLAGQGGACGDELAGIYSRSKINLQRYRSMAAVISLRGHHDLMVRA